MAITSVAPSLDEQHDARRRKYLMMMALRLACVVLAVVTAPVSLWLALALMLGAVVLPWCAVLIANDRPPKKASTFVRFRGPGRQRQIEAPKSGAED